MQSLLLDARELSESSGFCKKKLFEKKFVSSFYGEITRNFNTFFLLSVTLTETPVTLSGQPVKLSGRVCLKIVFELRAKKDRDCWSFRGYYLA